MKRMFLGILITFTLITPIFAQGRGQFGPPPGGAQRGQPPNPAAGLKKALDLTDAQVDAIKALMPTERDRVQAIMTEVQQKRQTLDALLNASSPVPTDVGNAAISLRASEKKLQGEHDWFIGELRKLLTGEQQQKLDTLLAANPRLPLGGFGGPGPRRGGPRPQ